MVAMGRVAADGVASMRVTGLVPAPAARGRARTGLWRVGAAEAAAAERRQWRWSPAVAGHPLPAGDYTVLLVDGEYSMCDAPFTLRNYVPFLDAAHGDVLLTGLGLGCLVRGLLARPAVRSVTVLELHADVIALVGPRHLHPALDLIHADALTWAPPPGRRFDVAMLDIDDSPGLVRRLVDHHLPHVGALWPNPDEVVDGPLGPDLSHLVTRARAAGARGSAR